MSCKKYRKSKSKNRVLDNFVGVGGIPTICDAAAELDTITNNIRSLTNLIIQPVTYAVAKLENSTAGFFLCITGDLVGVCDDFVNFLNT